MENIQGTFSLIVGIFSALTIILLAAAVIGWYTGRSSETKRYRRILMSQRDLVASYNVLKKDVDRLLKNLNGDKVDESKINDARFYLNRVSENLEKMNKYVVKGVNTIGKYDIKNKINNSLKF